MPNVFDSLKSRLGVPVVITLGSDGTSYRGTLIGVLPEGTDTSDGGANPTASDNLAITVKLARNKS